ncbi:hypothetical protein B1L11_05885 [Microbispora sp. GKU 823]|nr:hypothetical protein B1L11_05885 [Microbispora sp. GKU 823]
MSFAAQRDAAQSMPDGPPAALLSFYGAECGMKAAILDRLGLRSTAQLPEHLRNHDLHRLAKELRLSPSLCKRMQPCASQTHMVTWPSVICTRRGDMATLCGRTTRKRPLPCCVSCWTGVGKN